MKTTQAVFIALSALVFSAVAQAQQPTPGYPAPRDPVKDAVKGQPGLPGPGYPVPANPGTVPPTNPGTQPPVVVQPPPGPQPQLPPPVVDVPSYLVPNANELPQIYSAMMKTGRLANGAGHTVAAAQLVGCLPGLSPAQKAQTLMNVLAALSRSNIRVVSQAFREDICDNAEVTIIAAVLACKMGSRTPVMMVQTLTGGYQETLSRFRLLNELYQVEVAARLMQ